MPQNLGGGYLERTKKTMVNSISSMSDSIKRVVLAYRSQAANAAAIVAAVPNIPPPAPQVVPAVLTADDVILWLRQAAQADRSAVYEGIYGQCEYQVTINLH